MARHHRKLLRRLGARMGKGTRLVVKRNRVTSLWRWSVREVLHRTPQGIVYGPSIGTGETRREALAEARRWVTGGPR